VIKFLVVVFAFVASIAPVPSDTVERWFSTGIYPAIQRHLTALSDSLPFALFDVLVVAGCLGVFAASLRAVFQVRRTRRVWPAVRLVGNLMFVAALVYIVFLALWGLNYRRVSIASGLVVERGAPSPQEVTELGVEAVAQLNALHDEAHRSGWDDGPSSNGVLQASFIAAQRMLNDGAPVKPGRLKRTVFGPYFRWTSIDAMINPFGLEVLTNPDLLAFERPFVAAHEWSHLAGYANEAEASFLGWLACMRADVPAQYSGWLFLYWQVASEIDETGRAQLVNLLDVGPRRDIQAVADRLQRGQVPWLRTAGWRVYDQYLKVNRVEGGVRSYGAVLTLILGTRFEPNWTPVRRPVIQAPAS